MLFLIISASLLVIAGGKARGVGLILFGLLVCLKPNLFVFLLVIIGTLILTIT